MNKIKSLNLMITSRCNSACNMCNIWKSKNGCELSTEKLKKLLNASDFSEIEDVSISGGEPLLKSDISEFSVCVLKALPKLKMFFINTNGLMPEKSLELAKYLIAQSKAVNRELVIYFSVSIEGPKEIHEIIRGRSYDTSIKTVTLLKDLIYKNFQVMLSMTVQKKNVAHINEVSALAKYLGCNFSFRFADFSDNYYENSENKNIALSREESIKILEQLKDMFSEDKFFPVLYNHVCHQKNDIMLDADNNLICQAGKIFIFIKNDGNIYPCIYSDQVIGNIDDGLRPFSLERLKSCPCCTECHIYPMLNYSKNIDEQII